MDYFASNTPSFSSKSIIFCFFELNFFLGLLNGYFRIFSRKSAVPESKSKILRMRRITPTINKGTPMYKKIIDIVRIIPMMSIIIEVIKRVTADFRFPICLLILFCIKMYLKR